MNESLQRIFRIGPWGDPTEKYWVMRNFARRYRAKTVFGNCVEYEIRGRVSRFDIEAFNAARMWEDSAFDSLIDEYHETVFLRKLRSLGAWFMLVWQDYGEDGIRRIWPMVQVRRVESFDGGTRFAVFLQSDVIEAVESEQFKKNGCYIQPMVFTDNLWNEEIIQMNYEMIPESFLQRIKADEPYHAYEEALVAAGLKQKVELERLMQNAQSEQEHKTRYITVRTHLVGQMIHLSWDCDPGCNVLGFRKEDGFAKDKSDEGSNGTLIVDYTGNGSTIEQVEAGRTYYYTFILKSRLKEGGFWIADVLRFSVRVPTFGEIQELEKRAASLEVETDPDPKAERRRQVVESMEHFKGMLRLFDTEEQKGIEEIKARGLPAEDEADKINLWKEYIGSLRDRHLHF